ncbi:MAG: hypothetical protein CFE44_04155 [Burkholderiales bacterium PBB4]|nr:MAG: hypothetical protein CFE44_04155 [Burkholderiales bacterium PBB4]
MKFTPPLPDQITRATQGDLAALDAVIVAIQPGIFNLAVRMLGNRDDAADATQEILLKAVTHLGTFRGDAAFTTWVFQIARNHLLTASTRSKESPEVSLEGMAKRLQEGLDYGETLEDPLGHARVLTPEEKVSARQVALGCTQSMLMTLDREQRLAYILDTIFGLPSKEAAQVLDITPDAFRQRLTRARAKLDAFTSKTCGLANPQAACHCERQLPALAHVRASGQPQAPNIVAIHRAEMAQAAQQLDALMRLGDAAALMRSHPDYQAPAAQRQAIAAVLHAEGYLGSAPRLQ